MIGSDELRALQVGDCLETVPLLQGLSEEPVAFTVSSVAQEPGGSDDLAVTFELSYFGIPMGEVMAFVSDDTVEWEDA